MHDKHRSGAPWAGLRTGPGDARGMPAVMPAACRHASGMPARRRHSSGMPAGMPAGCAGMRQQACDLLAQASKLERILECLLSRRHWRGSKSFYYGRHSGILSILLAWVRKTDACWRMPAQPAGIPCRMPEGCLQAFRHAGMQAFRHSGIQGAWEMPPGVSRGRWVCGKEEGGPSSLGKILLSQRV